MTNGIQARFKGPSLVIGHWSLVIGHWSLVIGHWSLVIFSFVIRHSSIPSPIPRRRVFQSEFAPRLDSKPGLRRECPPIISHCSFVICHHLSFVILFIRQSSI